MQRPAKFDLPYCAIFTLTLSDPAGIIWAMVRFTIRGTRGSMPVCGREFLRYGGSTTCFTLETNEGLIVIDAGTGILSLNRSCREARQRQLPVTMLFTHFHLDHLIGLPGFSCLYDRDSRIRLMGDPNRGEDWRVSVRQLLRSPYWPSSALEMHDTKSLENLPEGESSMDIYGVKVSWCPVFHPQQCLSYRLETPAATVVVATDHEHSQSELSANFLEFCKNADFLIYDAMYTPEEYPARIGWGHGNWQQGVQLAIETGVKELIFTHHDAARTDSEIDGIVAKSRKFFQMTRAAHENMVLFAQNGLPQPGSTLI